jgi:hypothetical protein
LLNKILLLLEVIFLSRIKKMTATKNNQKNALRRGQGRVTPTVGKGSLYTLNRGCKVSKQIELETFYRETRFKKLHNCLCFFIDTLL